MDTHQYTIHVDQRGRLVLPVGIRHQLGIEQGSTLIMAMHEDGMLRLISPGESARRGRGLLRAYSGASWAPIPFDCGQ